MKLTVYGDVVLDNVDIYGYTVVPSTNILVDGIYFLDLQEASGWANIAKVNGVLAANIAAINSIPVASIAKINGVAV